MIERGDGRPATPTTWVLVRATTLTPVVAGFARELAEASRLPVAYVLDGRHAVSHPPDRPVVLVTECDCAALGLYCPSDFAWRCGDYGIYLARRRFPEATHFWLIEHDVRLAGGSAAEFFEMFAVQPAVDLLVSFLRPAIWRWHWYGTALGRGVRPYACLFTIVRLSATAIDTLVAKRARHARSAQRRADWANDEAFVATTLVNGSFRCRDINDFGRVYYTAQTLTTTNRLRGETFDPPRDGLRIYHPILYGDDFDRGNVTSRNLVVLTRFQKAVRLLRQSPFRLSRW